MECVTVYIYFHRQAIGVYWFIGYFASGKKPVTSHILTVATLHIKLTLSVFAYIWFSIAGLSLLLLSNGIYIVSTHTGVAVLSGNVVKILPKVTTTNMANCCI